MDGICLIIHMAYYNLVSHAPHAALPPCHLAVMCIPDEVASAVDEELAKAIVDRVSPFPCRAPPNGVWH